MVIRIFVVDDEHCIADTLAVILRNAGYEASAFYDAQSALEQAASRSPDLVISDVMMPGMNGVEMAVLMRERYPECKVLLFSGMASTLNILEMGICLTTPTPTGCGFLAWRHALCHWALA
jgi:DNA-binding response OmpR family regulator